MPSASPPPPPPPLPPLPLPLLPLLVHPKRGRGRCGSAARDVRISPWVQRCEHSHGTGSRSCPATLFTRLPFAFAARPRPPPRAPPPVELTPLCAEPPVPG